MGLLSLGTPLDWYESRKYNSHVRDNGINQLINIFKQHQDRDGDKFFWGDEVEYMLVDVDDKSKTARLSIDNDHILEELNDESIKAGRQAVEKNVSFHPEYGRFMIEATPLKPFDGNELYHYLLVEDNMKVRRDLSKEQLPGNVVPLTLTSFPRMGCKSFTSPEAMPIGPASQSLFLPDEIINRHARFPTLTANIRKRRGCKVIINLPIYPDKNTKLVDDSIPHRDLFDSDIEYKHASKPGHVYLDSMGFGMGSSCLQMTMQAKNLSEARYLYDALAPVTPLLLSLSAAAPIFKGYLVNQDVRWNVISGAVDDRTFIEKDIEPYPNYDYFGGLDVDDSVKQHFAKMGGGRGVNGDVVVNEFGDTKIQTKDGKPIQKIPKSRYASIDNYLTNDQEIDHHFNDIESPINKPIFDKLKKSGFDDVMAKHFAHLFIRDPLVVFSERVDQDNTLENDHFENIQSTNWQTLRFKPPSLYASEDMSDLQSKPGWRVEFRPTEIQLTDFENAAYSSFIILLSKAIIKFKPDFYIPILKIDENMGTAHQVDSAIDNKFWFKNFDHWKLDPSDYAGYDLSWFDRFINKGNDFTGYVNGYYNVPAHNTKLSDDCIKHKPCVYNSCKYTLNEIFNGNDSFPGLIKLVIKIVALELIPENLAHCNSNNLARKLQRLKNYLTLISRRASGKTPTIAHWLRSKVVQSPNYHQDSKINDTLNYEIIKLAQGITDLDYDNYESELFEYFGCEVASYLKSHKDLILEQD